VDRQVFGAVEVFRVIEWQGSVSGVDEVFPDAPQEVWQANADWLVPDFYDQATGGYPTVVQTWVLRSAGRTVLIDTGIGNGRDRPQFPPFAGMRTDFLRRLAAAGVDRHDVDVVVNTHLHYDHVGWNTSRAGAAWTPTFPNATYLLARADYDYFHPDSASRRPAPRTEGAQRDADGSRLMFADSIEPVERAGQLALWEHGHRIDATLRLEPAPGHTPGSAVVWLESATAHAVFVGDLLHSPLQIRHPDQRSTFDLDAAQARDTRRRVLHAAARSGATVFPAHFRGRGWVTVTAGPHPHEFTAGLAAS